MRASLPLAMAAAALFVLVSDARAWEAETTNAGLAERAALSSDLHTRLMEGFGLELGVYEDLTIAPDDAPALYEALARLDRGQGYTPGEAGTLPGIGWLTAGAVLAHLPAEHAVHHAYDAFTGDGFSSREIPGGLGGLAHRFGAQVAGARLLREGMPATAWLTHEDNPFRLSEFWGHYEAAASAQTPEARARHAASMLVAAGAIVHVVQDMASPARVRDDRASMLRRLGPDRIDVGSRFERLASLSYGRLGVPAPSREIGLRPSLTDYITAEGGDGLADLTARRFMSHGTLPESIEAAVTTPPHVLEARLEDSMRRPSPSVAAPLDLREAATDDGARLVDQSGVCIARYELRDRRLRWRIPDDCALEQIRVLLGEASAYGAGVIEWLFRGELALVESAGALEARAGGIGVRDATVTFFAEDEGGVREAFAETRAPASAEPGEVVARAALPGERAPARLVAVLRGEDEHGEPVVAAATLDR